MVKLSQTSVKDLEREDTCPYRWKKQWIDGEIEFPVNEAMTKGHYFEYLCLGGSAHDDSPITDLPRLKNGNKSADQKRIEKQAARFKNMITPGHKDFSGYVMIDTQISLKSNKDQGVVDMMLVDQDGQLFLGDLKYTGDIESTRTPYSWGHSLSELDLLQATTYSRLHKELHPNDYNGFLPFIYFIFDSTPNLGVKIGEVHLTDNGITNSIERFKAARQVIKLYNKNGWIKIPSRKECEGCSLVCDKRFYKSEIKRETITF